MSISTAGTAAALALLAAVALPLSAQMPASGARVRVVEEGRVLRTGSVVRFAGDTLTMTAGLAQPMVLVLGGNRRLEMATGRMHRHTLQGLGIGTGLGVLAGGLVGYATYQKVDCTGKWFCFDLGSGASAAGGAVLGGLAGMVLGAIVGAATSTEEWKPVARPVLHPAIVQTRAGSLVLGGSFSF